MNSIHRGRGWPRVWGNSGREGVCGGTAALDSTTSALMDFLAKERTGLHGDGRRNRTRITDRPRVVNRQARQTRWTALGISIQDRKSTLLNSSHVKISYAVFCLKNKN